MNEILCNKCYEPLGSNDHCDLCNNSQIIEYGYIWIGGRKITNPETDYYNQLTRDIARAKGEARENLLNIRHKFIVDCLKKIKCDFCGSTENIWKSDIGNVYSCLDCIEAGGWSKV